MLKLLMPAFLYLCIIVNILAMGLILARDSLCTADSGALTSRLKVKWGNLGTVNHDNLNVTLALRTRNHVQHSMGSQLYCWPLTFC